MNERRQAIVYQRYLWHCPKCGCGGWIEADRNEDFRVLRQLAGQSHRRLQKDYSPMRRGSRCEALPIVDIPMDISPDEWVGAA